MKMKWFGYVARRHNTFEFWWDEKGTMRAMTIRIEMILLLLLLLLSGAMICHLPLQESQLTKNVIKIMSQ